MNGDGKPDLVVGNLRSTALSVLLGNGNGTFQTQLTFAVPVYPTSLTVADVNGDGKPDIVVTETRNNAVGVLLGNGNGTFQAQESIAAGNYAISVAVTDANGDGRADLVAADGHSNTAVVLLNSANGNFTGQAYTLINPAAATQFVVSAGPASITAGSLVTFTVTAQDQFNETSYAYTGTIHFASSDLQAGLPADATLTGGVGTFTAILKTAGVQLLSATDILNKTISGTSPAIVITPTAATHFATSAPASTTAGTALIFTVTALDQFNNQAITYAGTVHFSSTDSAAALPADSALAFGLGTFSVTLKTSGTQTLTATDTTTSTIAGTSNAITVNPIVGSATHFAVSAPPATIAGNPFVITIKALDSAGNTASGYAGTVHFTSSDAQAGLPANATLVSGAGYFAAVLRTAASQVLTATDSATNSISGTSAAITTSPAAANHFTITLPGNIAVGTAFNVTVTAIDPYGNTATAYSGTVRISSSDGAAALPASKTLSSGVGIFSVTLNTPGNQTVAATDSVNGSITGGGTVSVSPLAATHFIVSAPSSSVAGSVFAFTVIARDSLGNIATGYSGTVHISSSDGQATLSADATLTAGIGFFGAMLRTAGNQTLTATDTTNASIAGTSAAIAVSPSTASHFVVSAPSTAITGSPLSFTVTAKDPFNNTAAAYTGTVHFTSSDASATLPANATLTGGTGIFSATLNTPGIQTITPPTSPHHHRHQQHHRHPRPGRQSDAHPHAASSPPSTNPLIPVRSTSTTPRAPGDPTTCC